MSSVHDNNPSLDSKMKILLNSIILALPTLVAALPGMALPDDVSESDESLKKRQSVLDAVTAAIGTASGLLGRLHIEGRLYTC